VDLSQPRSDLTIVEVPLDCVGYVTGRGGVVLRSLEMEFKTLMFFLTGEGERERENLVIFGSPRGRCAVCRPPCVQPCACGANALGG